MAKNKPQITHGVMTKQELKSHILSGAWEKALAFMEEHERFKYLYQLDRIQVESMAATISLAMEIEMLGEIAGKVIIAYNRRTLHKKNNPDTNQ